jgi:hypothetical protein
LQKSNWSVSELIKIESDLIIISANWAKTDKNCPLNWLPPIKNLLKKNFYLIKIKINKFQQFSMINTILISLNWTDNANYSNQNEKQTKTLILWFNA